MYAIKKNINKVLAAFLCACLLLSYNPAFGAVDAAWADTANGNGSMSGSYAPAGSNTEVGNVTTNNNVAPGGDTPSTIIQASTYTSELQTDGPAEPIYGTVAQIGNSRPYPVYVEATYADGPEADDYVFTWEIKKDGTTLTGDEWTAILADNHYFPNVSMNTRDVAQATVNLGTLIYQKNTLFKDDAKYEFVCTVKTKNGPEQVKTQTITVYTVDENDKKGKYDNEDLTNDSGVKVTGNFLQSSELKTDMEPGTDQVKDAFNYYADGQKQHGDDFSYSSDTPYHIDITTKLSIGDEPQPAYEGPFDIWLPIDDKYLYNDSENGNRRGFQENDAITVMWKVTSTGNSESTVQPIKAQVTKDPDTGELMAKFQYAPDPNHPDDPSNYPPSCIGPDGTVTTGAKGNVYPGYFAVLLPGDKLAPKDEQVTYYTVEARVDGGHGTIPQDFVSLQKTGEDTGFDIIPDVSSELGGESYMLNELWFYADGDDSNKKNVLTQTVPGVKLDAARSHVTVTDPLKSTDNYDRTYTFVAKFSKVTTTPDRYADWSLNLNVVDSKTKADSDKAVIQAAYQKRGNGGTIVTASDNVTKGALQVAKNGQVQLTFLPHAPMDGKTYGIVGVETSLDGTNWTTASFSGGSLNIPALTSSMFVRALVSDSVENTPTTTYFNVNVSAVGGGSVDPTQGIISWNATSHSSMTINLDGNTTYYPSSITVDGVDAGYTNSSKKITDDWTYDPSAKPAGDVSIVVNFDPVSGIRYELEISNTVNGSIELLGKTPSSTGYAAGENLPLLVTPADGYTVDKIEATITKSDGTTETRDLTSFWQAGVVNFQMPDGDTQVTATFKTKTTTLPPSGDPNETYALNVYVAGSELPDPGYSMNSVSASDVIVGDGSVAANRNVSMSGFSQANGNVNGSKGFTAAVKHGGDFVLNLDPSTNPQSVVAKVLLVEYSLNGTTKTPTRYKLYHQSLPVFNVMNITQNTDVYVYFTPVTPGQTVPTYEYVTVTTSITGKGTTPQLGPVKVVKGSSLSITIEPQTGSEWNSLKWQATGGNEVDLTATVTAESAKDQPYTLNLTKIAKDTAVTAVFSTNGVVPDPDTYNVYAKDADGTAVAAGHTVAAVVNGTTQTLTTSGYPINKESNFDVTVTPKSGTTLENLKFTWDDSNVKAFYNASTATILFAKGTTSTPSGYTPYDPAQDSLGAMVSAKSTWHVNNLVCDLTVVPTFTTGSNPPNPPAPSDDDYYTVTTHIGSGLGQITTDNADKSNPLKIAKPAAGANPQQLQVSFTGSKGADGTQYVIDSVTILRSSDNGWLNFWEWITGNKTAQQYEQEAINNGWVNLPINADYDITVNFKTEGAAPGYVEKDNWAAVNVTSNSLKGSVSPQGTPAALVPKSGDASYKQFIVSPEKDSNDKFYAVKTVTVNWKNAQGVDQGPLVVNAGTSDANQVITWDTTFNNVFTLHVDKLGLTQENMYAVNVEVDYSDSGELGNGSVVGEDPNTLMKTVNVSVYVNGVAVGGTSNTGGTVAPRDTFTMIQNQTVKTYPYGYTSTPIVVAPAQGYEVTRITKDGVANAAYLQSVLNKGYFDVTSQGPENTAATENIIIYLTQKPLGDRSFTVFAMLDPNGSQKGAVAPNILVSLDKDQDYFFCTQPNDYYIGVTKITDQYWTGSDWADVPAGTPNSCSWTRTEMNGTGIYSGSEYASGVFPGFTVKAVTVNGKIPNRRVLVTFGDLSDYPGNKKPNNDYTTENSDRASIKVNVWGDGCYALINGLSPKGGLRGIYKSDNAKYSWSYTLPADSADGGYRVFCIEKNGTVAQGKRTGYTKRDLSQEGTVTFTKADLTRSGYDNTLDIYVRWFTTDQLNGGAASEGPGITGWGDDNGYVTSRSANGGAVSSSKTTYGAAAPAAVDVADRISTAALNGEPMGTTPIDQTTTPPPSDSSTLTPGGDITLNPELPPDMSDNSDLGVKEFVPVDFYMVPADDYMVDQVYLYNCKVAGFEVLAPKDVPVPEGGTADTRTERVALKYRLELTDTSKPGYLYATYTKYDGSDQVAKWTQTYIDSQQENNALDYTMSVAVSPKTAVEALVSDTSQIHGKIITVTNGDPMVALQPTTAANGDAYEVTFDTVKIDPTKATFSAEVGPLIKWNSANNELSTLYAIDEEALAAKGYSVEPVKTGTQKQLTYGASEDEVDELADDNTVIPAAADDTKPDYYTRYTVSGPVNASDLNGKNLTVNIPLKKISLADGNFPEYTQTKPNPNTTYQLSARVDGEGGTITPTSTTVAGAWNGGDNIGPWTVASGTYVAFKVEANEGYLLDTLTLNGTINCLPRYFNQSTSTLLFPVNLNSDVVAKFVSRNSAEAMRTVTISVQGGHGTTSPAPGEHKVEKGSTYAVTFVPDSGYVPYRIWVDGVESFVSPTLAGWSLPAAWSNQTFTVEYQPSGTTPSGLNYLVQTGQNAANDVAAGLVKTGDNPVAIACIVGVAALAAVGVWQLRRRKATAARAAKYSVTKRK